MKAPVSFVIAATRERDALEAGLTALLAELARRAAGDEVLLVEEAGERTLAAWIAERFPQPETFEGARYELRTLARPRAGGFAAAVASGVEKAAHELVCLLDARTRVSAHFLEPMIEALSDETIFAACARVQGAQAPLAPVWRAGRMELEPVHAADSPQCELAFATRGALLVRRADFLARGFDPLFESEGWAFSDLAWSARRAGRRVVCVNTALVELEPRSTADAELAALAAAKNQLLFTWKHLDEEGLWREHLAALLREVLRASAADEGRALVPLALALEELPALARSRPTSAAKRRFGALLAELASSGAAREGHEREL